MCYIGLFCTKLKLVYRAIFFNFSGKIHQTHNILMLLKNQIFLTYLYRNHKSISTYILYFLKKYFNFLLQLCQKVMYFRSVCTNSNQFIKLYFAILRKNTSNLHHNDVSKLGIFDSVVPKSHQYFGLYFVILGKSH